MKTLPVFFAAPHRVMFFAGAFQALTLMAFWSADLGARYAGVWPLPAWPLLNQVPAGLLHALLMSCGVFSFFIFGFILTAGPRWQGAGELSQGEFLPPFALLAGGWLLTWVALQVPQLLLAGLGCVFTGWCGVAAILLRIARHPAMDREHIGVVATAVVLGAVAVASFGVFAAGGTPVWARLAIVLAIWGFLLPVFLAVAHRMLPFFTSSALPGYVLRRPSWALRTLLVLSLAHGALSLFGKASWLWLADFPAALAAGYLTWLWWDRRVIAHRLLAVLHLAFAWLAMAFALSAVQSLLYRVAPGLLGQAPLHALTLGFFASMLIGMASRVTMGHSGRPVAANREMWGAFLTMQVAAILRVASELPALPGAHWLMWFSSLCWLGAFALWSWRHAPALWRPRADGRPG